MSDLESAFPITYMLDTNLLRYLTGKASSQIEEQRLKKSAEEFWSKALEEVRDLDASILLPQEVVRELAVMPFRHIEIKYGLLSKRPHQTERKSISWSTFKLPTLEFWCPLT